MFKIALQFVDIRGQNPWYGTTIGKERKFINNLTIFVKQSSAWWKKKWWLLDKVSSKSDLNSQQKLFSYPADLKERAYFAKISNGINAYNF